MADSVAARTRVAEPEIAVHAAAIAAVAAVAENPSVYAATKSAWSAMLDASLRRTQPRLEHVIRSLHGQALTLAGMCDGALAEYGRAQSLLDSLALSEGDVTTRSIRFGSTDLPARRALGVLATCGTAAPRVRQFAGATHARKAGASATRVEPLHGASGRRNVSRPSVRGGVAVVDFTLLEDEALALVMTSARDTIVRLPVSADTLASLVRRLRRGAAAIVGTSLDLDRTWYDTVAAHALYSATLGALAPLIAHSRHLTIIPDGALALVPFDGLIMRPGPAPEFVIDRFVVSSSPSLGDALAASRVAGTRRPGAVVVVAPDSLLPGVREEVKRVRAAWPSDRVRLLMDESATHDAVAGAVRGAAVVHFATHAASNDAHPATSYLALAASPGADRRLDAIAAASLDLAGALVVLSACETGAGRVAGRAGALSLSRSLLDGGAHAVVSTLWAVGAGSADIAGDLHEALARGMPVSDALRESKLAARSAGQSPLAWAGWTLTTRGGRGLVTFSSALRQ
jgi:CHAT domain-containing protein